MEHARIQPSSMARILVCPASVRLSEEVGPQPAGRAAEVGHILHAMFERGMNGASIQPDVVELENLIHHEYSPKQAVRLVERALIAKNKLLEKYSAISVLAEQRVPCGGSIGVPDFWGTADIIAFNERSRTLVVGDLKTGFVRVKPERSPQLMSYAMGAIHLLGWRPKRIVLAIIQPPKTKIDPAIWETDADTLETFAEEVRTAIAAIDTAPPNPTDSGCKYCPAKKICFS